MARMSLGSSSCALMLLTLTIATMQPCYTVRLLTARRPWPYHMQPVRMGMTMETVVCVCVCKRERGRESVCVSAQVEPASWASVGGCTQKQSQLQARDMSVVSEKAARQNRGCSVGRWGGSKGYGLG